MLGAMRSASAITRVMVRPTRRQINYLIPVDVMGAEDDKVWFESSQQTAIIFLSKQAPNATHYVVFGACRNALNTAGAVAKALGTGFVPIADTAGLLPMRRRRAKRHRIWVRRLVHMPSDTTSIQGQ